MTQEPDGYPAERTKTFADAVVAIAMTLLILPLLESVGEAGREGLDAAEWLAAEAGPVYLFVTSFAVVAMFWLIHHRLFFSVERVTAPLILLLMAWLLTIVWLPVATAMTGAFDDDPLQKSVYIGSMALTVVITIAIRLYLRSHPTIMTGSEGDVRAGLAVDLAMVTLFGAALALAIAVPSVGYYALFLLMLTSLLERVYARILGVAALAG